MMLILTIHITNTYTHTHTHTHTHEVQDMCEGSAACQINVSYILSWTLSETTDERIYGVSVCLSVYLPSPVLSVCLSLSVCLPPPILPVCLSICLSVCLLPPVLSLGSATTTLLLPFFPKLQTVSDVFPSCGGKGTIAKAEITTTKIPTYE